MLILNSVSGLGNLLVPRTDKQKHSVNMKWEMDLGYFERQQL